MGLLALLLLTQTAADSSGIRQAALDYIEGYYDGDGARMERAVHPELAKRIVNVDDRGRYRLGQMSAMTLVEGTRAGGGRDTPEAERRKDFRILDIYQNAASARIYAFFQIDEPYQRFATAYAALDDYGYYTIVGRNAAGHESEHRGKFAKVWQRGRDGVWRIRSDSCSSAPRS